MRRINAEELSKDDLVNALVFTACQGAETGEQRNAVKSYYDLLSVEQLRKKAAVLGELWEEDYSVVERFDNTPYVKEKHRYAIHKDVAVKRAEVRDAAHECVTDLFIRSYVEEVTVICDNIIGVKCDKKFRKKVQRIADKYGMEIIYG